MALFARTNFLFDVNSLGHYWIGYSAVAIGALSWWFFITWIMNKVRNHFKIRSLFLVNKVIAVVMVVVSMVGFALGVASEIRKVKIQSGNKHAVSIESEQNQKIMGQEESSTLCDFCEWM